MSNPATAALELPSETAPAGQDEYSRTQLDARDRCDACGHRAWVEVTLAFGALTMCAHHYAKNETQLAALGADIHDERHRLGGRGAAPADSN